MINRIIRAIAGTFIILSVLLGMYVNENWYWFTIFVGANLLQSSFTKWCLMENILRKIFKIKD
ncbi:YgaP family membrane protein [Flavobacterium sp.]|uniref:YgaP family membrane protein n=1 Tax=Flavobacterium sp. TaxID=239 RepID=UPI003F695DEC